MSRNQVPTARQARFIAEYVKDLNGTKAAVRAGFSKRSARAIANELLAKPHIDAEIRRLEQQHLEKAGISAEAVLEQLRRIAFFDVATIYERVQVEQADPRTGELRLVTRHRMLHPSQWPFDARTALANYQVLARRPQTGDGESEEVVKLVMEPKLQALELLAKHLGLTSQHRSSDQTVTIKWLAPEPLPLPTTETAWVPPAFETSGMELQRGDEENGSGQTPAAPNDRTDAQSFFDSQGARSSSVTDEDEPCSAAAGLSRRALLKMCPEILLPDPNG